MKETFQARALSNNSIIPHTYGRFKRQFSGRAFWGGKSKQDIRQQQQHRQRNLRCLVEGTPRPGNNLP